MASVNAVKWTTGGACRGWVDHIYRENQNYSNEDVRVERMPDNLYIGTADECRDAIHAMIAECDAILPPQRVRADRKTVVGLDYPAPREGMSREDSTRFFERLYADLTDAGYLIVGGAIHADEIHDYIDPSDHAVHTSREHLHLAVIPWTDDRGLNCKTWLTKSRYRELNQIADRACEHEFGYSYQDGSQRRSRGSVEAVKMQSAIAAARELPRLEARRDELRDEVDKTTMAAQNAAEQAQRASQDAQTARDEVAQLADQRDRLRAEVRQIDTSRYLVEQGSSGIVSEARKCARKTLSGKIALPISDFEALCRQADDADACRAATRRMDQARYDAEREASTAMQRARVEAERISMDELMRQLERDGRLERYEAMERRYPDVFRQMREQMEQTREHSRHHSRGRSR